MNNKFRILNFLIFLSIYFFLCDENDYLNFALFSSNLNRPELEKVLSHYQNDQVKLEQVEFLIMNMPEHFLPIGELVDKYGEYCEC